MNRSITLLILPLLLGSVSRAWWVDYSFEPKAIANGNIQANEYHKHFAAIEFFSCESDKYFTIKQCQEIAQNGGFFNTVRDLNEDGVLESWSVGVARYESGEYPYANVVVVTNPESNEITDVLTVELESPSFAIFFSEGTKLSLFFCMECGSFAEIKRVKNKWVLAWPNPQE